MKTHITLALIIFAICAPLHANALQYSADDFSFKLTGYASGGIIEPTDEKPDFLGDWRLRGQGGYKFDEDKTIALVYAIDAATIDENGFMREGFAFFEQRGLGRAEFGFTDSIARKLGLGLPDVGGMRVNDKPLFYKKIHPNGAVISDTTLTTGRNALRINMATAPISGAQYGLSVAGLTDDYDYSIDAGLKLRQPTGKTKTAISVGASFMSKPDRFRSDSYTPRVTADWRTQMSAGFNLQYNSWIWGTTARVIYDHNPIGTVSDGIVAGTGVSYDLLKYSISLTYIISDTGIWHNDVKNYTDQTILASFRYKYSENVDGWMSIGMTTDTPFVSANLRLTF